MSRLLGHLDIGRALIALVISLLLFAYVRTEANPPEIATFEVPVEMVDVPPGLLLPASQPPSVRVRVTAPRDTLSGIRSTSLRAFVDLRRGSTGVSEYPVGVEVPDPRVRLMEVVPSELPVRLEEVGEKRVQVHVARVGTVPLGYEAGAAEIEPREITVSGPTSLLQRVAAANVDVRLDGITAPVDAAYLVSLVDAEGQTIQTEGRSARISPETVRVRLSISQLLSYKTVPVRAVVTGNADIGYTIEGITVEPSSVTLVGSPANLANVDALDTQQVEVGDATASIVRQVPFRVPSGLSVSGENSARVTVRIVPLVVLQPFSIPIAVTGVQPGLQVITPLPFAQAVFRGPTPVLRNIDPGQLRATVDLSGRGPGLHEVPVQFAFPAELNVQSTTPTSVAIRIAGPEGTTAVEPAA